MSAVAVGPGPHASMVDRRARREVCGTTEWAEADGGLIALSVELAHSVGGAAALLGFTWQAIA